MRAVGTATATAVDTTTVDEALLRRRRLFAAALAHFDEMFADPAARLTGFVYAVEELKAEAPKTRRAVNEWTALRSAFRCYISATTADRQAWTAAHLRGRLLAFGRAIGADVPDDLGDLA